MHRWDALNYYRTDDGIHHVPKLMLDYVLIGTDG